MSRFTSKTQAMNQRRIVWVCKTCDAAHDKQQLNLTGRPTVCLVCKAQRDFYYFPSRAEVTRFNELRLQQKTGLISQLEMQVSYPIIINSVPITKYIADFVYVKKGQRIIEDVKGSKDYLTDIFKLKQKLIGAIYGVSINLIERS